MRFLSEFWNYSRPLAADDDMFDCVAITGDDAFVFVTEFASEFDVDMSNYRWYFHHEEEGHNFGGLFFKPPNQRVNRIPITISLLAKAIDTKIWPIDYPEHKLPRVRLDMLINQVSVVGVVVLVGFFIWGRFIS